VTRGVGQSLRETDARSGTRADLQNDPVTWYGSHS
jgi:hypothetical protein